MVIRSCLSNKFLNFAIENTAKKKKNMLKEIVSISGKPGLFKLVSKGKNVFIAESLIDQKRIPVYSRDKVVSLGDITVYSTEGDVRLARILQSMKQKENGETITFSPTITTEELRAYFSQVLPDFDRGRVYPSDIKKMMNWYNLLVKCGLTEFEEEEEQKSEENETGETENNEETGSSDETESSDETKNNEEENENGEENENDSSEINNN